MKYRVLVSPRKKARYCPELSRIIEAPTPERAALEALALRRDPPPPGRALYVLVNRAYVGEFHGIPRKVTRYTIGREKPNGNNHQKP